MALLPPLLVHHQLDALVQCPFGARGKSQNQLTAGLFGLGPAAGEGVVYHQLLGAARVVHARGVDFAGAVVVHYHVFEVGGVDPHLAFAADDEGVLAAHLVDFVGGSELAVGGAGHVGIAEDGVAELMLGGEA